MYRHALLPLLSGTRKAGLSSLNGIYWELSSRSGNLRSCWRTGSVVLYTSVRQILKQESLVSAQREQTKYNYKIYNVILGAKLIIYKEKIIPVFKSWAVGIVPITCGWNVTEVKVNAVNTAKVIVWRDSQRSGAKSIKEIKWMDVKK